MSLKSEWIFDISFDDSTVISFKLISYNRATTKIDCVYFCATIVRDMYVWWSRSVHDVFSKLHSLGKERKLSLLSQRKLEYGPHMVGHGTACTFTSICYDGSYVNTKYDQKQIPIIRDSLDMQSLAVWVHGNSAHSAYPPNSTKCMAIRLIFHSSARYVRSSEPQHIHAGRKEVFGRVPF